MLRRLDSVAAPLCRRLGAVLVASSLVGGLAACGPSGTSLSDSASDSDIEAGRVLFEQSCAACHGIGGVGTDQGPTFLDDVYEPSHHADGAFVVAVRNGVPEHHWHFGDMPPQPGLSDDEVAQIVSYVRLLQRDAGIQ